MLRGRLSAAEVGDVMSSLAHDINTFASGLCAAVNETLPEAAASKLPPASAPHKASHFVAARYVALPPAVGKRFAMRWSEEYGQLDNPVGVVLGLRFNDAVFAAVTQESVLALARAAAGEPTVQFKILPSLPILVGYANAHAGKAPSHFNTVYYAHAPQHAEVAELIKDGLLSNKDMAAALTSGNIMHKMRKSIETCRRRVTVTCLDNDMPAGTSVLEMLEVPLLLAVVLMLDRYNWAVYHNMAKKRGTPEINQFFTKKWQPVTHSYMMLSGGLEEGLTVSNIRAFVAELLSASNTLNVMLGALLAMYEAAVDASVLEPSARVIEAKTSLSNDMETLEAWVKSDELAWRPVHMKGGDTLMFAAATTFVRFTPLAGAKPNGPPSGAALLAMQFLDVEPTTSNVDHNALIYAYRGRTWPAFGVDSLLFTNAYLEYNALQHLPEDDFVLTRSDGTTRHGVETKEGDSAHVSSGDKLRVLSEALTLYHQRALAGVLVVPYCDEADLPHTTLPYEEAAAADDESDGQEDVDMEPAPAPAPAPAPVATPAPAPAPVQALPKKAIKKPAMKLARANVQARAQAKVQAKTNKAKAPTKVQAPTKAGKGKSKVKATQARVVRQRKPTKAVAKRQVAAKQEQEQELTLEAEPVADTDTSLLSPTVDITPMMHATTNETASPTEVAMTVSEADADAAMTTEAMGDVTAARAGQKRERTEDDESDADDTSTVSSAQSSTEDEDDGFNKRRAGTRGGRGRGRGGRGRGGRGRGGRGQGGSSHNLSSAAREIHSNADSDETLYGVQLLVEAVKATDSLAFQAAALTPTDPTSHDHLMALPLLGTVEEADAAVQDVRQMLMKDGLTDGMLAFDARCLFKENAGAINDWMKALHKAWLRRVEFPATPSGAYATFLPAPTVQYTTSARDRVSVTFQLGLPLRLNFPAAAGETVDVSPTVICNNALDLSAATTGSGDMVLAALHVLRRDRPEAFVAVSAATTEVLLRVPTRVTTEWSLVDFTTLLRNMRTATAAAVVQLGGAKVTMNKIKLDAEAVLGRVQPPAGLASSLVERAARVADLLVGKASPAGGEDDKDVYV